MSSTAENKILIVGAGPGGLALAQILRAQSIPYEIFERDETPTSRNQGWAVALVECIPELEELLPKDLGSLQTTSVNYGITDADTFSLVSAVTGEVTGRLGAVPRGQPGYILRANREHFRQFLLQKSKVQLGKIFERYEQDRDGVTVFFRDGSSARGAILVGADGGHSRVRQQLLGPEGSKLVPSRYMPLISEVTLSKEQYAPIHEIGSSGVLASGENLRYLVGMLEALDSGESARYYAAGCYAVDDPVAETRWIQSASRDELYKKALEISARVPPVVGQMMIEAGPEGISMPPIKFEEFVTPSALPRGRVTLMGDSAHTMVPFRGAGANTAVNDACLMARLLMEEKERGGALDAHWVLQKYEEVMLPRGKAMVLASRAAGADDMAPLHGRINAAQH